MEDRRIELLLHACKAHVLPLSLIPRNLVETVGIEPTVFLMSLIYSQLPSPLGTHLQIEFVSSSTTLLEPFTRINKLERDSVRHLGSVQRSPRYGPPQFPAGGS